MIPRVSIIIVNWNGRHHLAECLDSISVQTFRGVEVVLVDNGSTDGSVSFVRERYPWVKLVGLSENTGFATGNNRGLEQSVGEYLVTLNNDTKAEPNWLAELVAVADAHPGVGMVGCRICSFADPDIVDSLGFGICRDGMSRGLFRRRRYSLLNMGSVEEILVPSACAALYRRAMIDEIGFFDDDFFAYAEDTDLGLRGRFAGWGALLATQAVVLHKYSRTGGAFSPLKIFLVERNHYWVAMKNFPLSCLLLVPAYTLLRYLAQLRLVLTGSGSGGEFRASGSSAAIAVALVRGIWHALAGMPRVMAKRARIMNKRRLTPGEMADLIRRYRLSFRELLDDSGD
ncbi:N-acetylglucosaminyl-diphospho-decaprenol L-rhamnosyltransferase [Geobacter sp. OR-1]|uniref:glycosyltransferase family 2 protein n=1 Tax=Geobacter sp. OR-1 TaxID=1266765 RepID=UPI0005443AAD|nr:glycosyltransferase family 2 protein [Geobacter sp. OR-1]GAM11019.1 N-acetylglucosaminyl-diphospho-decaprenol L-rhamnosyltransferase [Geobacter sp. OR-1]